MNITFDVRKETNLANMAYESIHNKTILIFLILHHSQSLKNIVD